MRLAMGRRGGDVRVDLAGGSVIEDGEEEVEESEGGRVVVRMVRNPNCVQVWGVSGVLRV